MGRRSGAVGIDASVENAKHLRVLDAGDDDVEAVADVGVTILATVKRCGDVSAVIFKVKNLFDLDMRAAGGMPDAFLFCNGGQRILNDGKAAALDENDAKGNKNRSEHTGRR